jgi:hypothetical protein
VRAVPREAVDLLEGAVVEEGLDALHRRELALGMLLIDGCLPAPRSICPTPDEFIGLLTRGARHPRR